MGLFGSSDDSDDSKGVDETAESDMETTGESEGTRTEERVHELVDEIRDLRGSEQTEWVREVMHQFDESRRDRLIAVRTLARVAHHDPSILDPVIDPVVDLLADRELARPIAEDVLGSAQSLQSTGVGSEVVVTGTLDGLNEAMNGFGAVRIDPETVAGGGAAEIALASQLRQYADSVGGREQLAIEGVADALEGVPRLLALRAGLDPLDAIVDMRSKWDFETELLGIDTERGELHDATESSIHLPEQEVRNRITDGIALGTIVFCTRGTVTQLGSLTDYDPYLESPSPP